MPGIAILIGLAVDTTLNQEPELGAGGIFDWG